MNVTVESRGAINIVNSKLITPPKSEKANTSQNSSKISVPCVAPKVKGNNEFSSALFYMNKVKLR